MQSDVSNAGQHILFTSEAKKRWNPTLLTKFLENL